MTALAMIIGMVPMALGLGEGGEQNAPLGRAVIGGLALATVATLFFVPSVFALLHGRRPTPRRQRRITGSECRTVGRLVRGSAASCCWRSLLGLAFWGISTRAKSLDAGYQGDARAGGADRLGHRAGARRSAAGDRRCQARCRHSPTPPSMRGSSGYLRKWYVDLGSRVRAGQVLADIDTPGSRPAARAGARRSRHGPSEREACAVDRRTVSRSDQDRFGVEAGPRQRQRQPRGEERRSLFGEGQRQTAGAAQAFGKITAPFDGVVTARSTDVGALIDSGSNAKELFHVAAVHRLRVFVNVPRFTHVRRVPGMKADLTLTEFPGRAFTGTAGAHGAVDRRHLAHAADRNRRRERRRGAAAGVLRGSASQAGQRAQRPSSCRSTRSSSGRRAYRSRWSAPTARWRCSR